ncbi:MAG: YbhN family protein [Actinomycetota bacterium]|nr:YbhN family protein [Actinomycetota bacterium]
MAETQLARNRPAATAVITSPGRTRSSVVRRVIFAVFLPAMLTVYLIAAAPTMVSAVGSLASASPLWLLAGLAATVLSMVAFAALRGRTLAVGGARISLRRTLAASYGAGAVHTTLPGGAVFSTTYAFRHLRAWGASASATTWSMAITGLLSTLSLSAVGLLGLALSTGTGGSLILPVLEILLAVAVIFTLVRISRRPDRVIEWAYAVLVRLNRLRRRPAQAGAGRLAQIVTDLRMIRPTTRDWIVAAALALANWALDCACLAACCAAVGVHVGYPALLITYTAGMAAGSLLPLPAGLGAVETAMTLGLTVAGAAASPALAAVLLYRLLSTGSVVILGWLVVAAQRLQPGTPRRRSITSLQTGTP